MTKVNHEPHQCRSHECKRVRIEMQAEIDRLKADKSRLDWLADKDNRIGNVQLPINCVMNNIHDMRAAIDEAMRLDPEVISAMGGASE